MKTKQQITIALTPDEASVALEALRQHLVEEGQYHQERMIFWKNRAGFAKPTDLDPREREAEFSKAEDVFAFHRIAHLRCERGVSLFSGFAAQSWLWPTWTLSSPGGA